MTTEEWEVLELARQFSQIMVLDLLCRQAVCF